MALIQAGYSPPYIFGAWSFGGMISRIFASLYPNDVSGMVLVDPACEEFYVRLEREFPELKKEDDAYIQEVLNGKNIGEREEIKMVDSTIDQARRSDQLHTTPTTLLIAAGKTNDDTDRDTSKAIFKVWAEELENWAKKRPNMQYQFIANSGHHIARQQPDTVVKAIRTHLDQYYQRQRKLAGASYKKPDQLNDGLQTATLKEVGLNEGMIRIMTDSIVNGDYPNVHSVLIFRNNKLVFENYFPGIDQHRGKGNVGFVEHHRDSLHDLRSVSKSFVGAAILIAVDQGRIRSLDQKIFDFFPEHAKLDTGMKKDITIKHLLTMTSGIEWSEDLPYNDPRNSETQMNRSADPVLFYLSQPLLTRPGSFFNYSGGATQVLAAIVKRATGMAIDDFTAKHLFLPLGISDFHWVKRRDGIPIAASGLRLKSRDFLKFGILLLNEGKWNKKHVISQRLLGEAMQMQTMDTAAGTSVLAGFGYHIWVPTYKISPGPVTLVRAAGNGGQNIFVDRKQNLVTVITAGNYNNWMIRKSPSALYMDFIRPAIIK
jgi:CubicO group peptidase (beta-lactamase class C family)